MSYSGLPGRLPAAFLSTFLLAATAFGQSNSAPALTNLRILTPTIASSAASQSATVELTTSDPSGIVGFLCSFQDPANSSKTADCSPASTTLVSGTALSGVWDTSVMFPAFPDAGGWTLSFLWISDNAGNLLKLGASDLTSRGFASTISVSATNSGNPTPASTPYDLVFPQFATGGGIGAELVLTNLSSHAATVSLAFYGASGTPIPLPASSGPSTLVVAAFGSAIYRTAASGASQVGWLYVSSVSVEPIAGILTLTIPGVGIQAVAGDMAATALSPLGYLVAVHRDATGIDTGVAIAYPDGLAGASATTAVLTLRDLNGSTVATSSITIPPNGHIAEFVSQLLPGSWTLLASFDGTLAIGPAPATSAGFLVNAFQLGPGEFVTEPVGALFD